ncbi:FtsW/RodA/SpoVE family cell cycle protein [Vagococcus carniphilus]|uniref:FtsW/RodA/SpoVE family cell cycle protein n=1 Tax=Vagococcus carniphilus TaxID=218144 RepID=A0A430AR45_9ENTE|nr:FtsW/RodA/SpoVE family cell cycle protein [Vagococcus carniphilus]MDT2814117.1 FtsW/RodA/SpoVE family cell cycle protein [Vagococcus carniphilus]MDT2830320.1 FtsW/RodA/SpoVE family cell cycle protein [Vagococcus carniphilus]MDT2834241.1 FtsW/RodA/SpoVE family cell cycle protein [Vagococcus carniphilus]MDT2840111.1 FtsW/RodA/SpoVE family cell cycle protein [Vagococcus carniphilus]MDT2847900.1 FtsW/RodA/SpoVE family cell cycle protein [Vagococcus carniphilus]
MQRINKRQIKSVDYGILLPVFLLSIVGMISLYVALDKDGGTNIVSQMLQQGLWYVIGVIFIFIVMQFSPKVVWKLTPIGYVFGLGVMTALLFYYDANLATRTGSKNWFRIGSLTFQPAELMKIAYILILAYIVTAHNIKNRQRTLKTDGMLILKLVIATIPVGILLKLQNDFGTMLVFIAILGGIFIMSGISWKIIIPVVVTFTLLGAGILYLVTTDAGREVLYSLGFKSYQFARIDSWIDPFHDATGNSYQQAQALKAIGSGGVGGKGFNVSDVYVPVRESDMIFSVIAENFGFIGSCFVIFLYFILIYRMIRVCFDTNNEFFSYIATGVIMMILFHVFENIGANIGLLPLTGIPLPFISQGGSSLISNMIGVGLVMSMRYQYQPEEYGTLDFKYEG